jgi:hypothetical protein
LREGGCDPRVAEDSYVAGVQDRATASVPLERGEYLWQMRALW